MCQQRQADDALQWEMLSLQKIKAAGTGTNAGFKNGKV